MCYAPLLLRSSNVPGYKWQKWFELESIIAILSAYKLFEWGWGMVNGDKKKKQQLINSEAKFTSEKASKLLKKETTPLIPNLNREVHAAEGVVFPSWIFLQGDPAWVGMLPCDQPRPWQQQSLTVVWTFCSIIKIIGRGKKKLSFTSLNHKPLGKVNKLATLRFSPIFNPFTLSRADWLWVGKGRYRIQPLF